MKYCLEVIFRKKQTQTLYDGISYLKKNLSDHLRITDKTISLEFVRTGKVDEKQFLETPGSLIRYELQRALTFYVVTMGTIPPISKILLWKGEVCSELKHEHFTNTWRHCDIKICIPSKVCKRIFTDDPNAKNIYIAITYFVKAQLVQFSNDAFRTAWTGLNAIYRIFRKDDSEAENRQLDRLIEKLNITTTVSSLGEVKELQPEFWKSLEWYQLATAKFVRGKGEKQFIQESKYNDFVIQEKLLAENLRNGFNDPIRIERMKKVVEERKVNYLARLNFLLCEYGYMLRNRNFHAAKAYPIFVIAEDAETKNEKILTRIILLTIKDVLVSEII